MRRIHRLIAFAATLASSSTPIGAQSWQSAVDRAAKLTTQTRIVVIDIAGGRIVAAHRLDDAARTLAAPGSTLKPLVLYGLVSARRWNSSDHVACNRALVVAGHRLACSHPAAPPFDARQALTWSCNTYFAALARTLQPGELGQLLRPTGLLSATGWGSAGPERGEAEAEFREPATPEAEQLAVLGVEGVRVTPLEMAAAYRWLALELEAHPDADAARVVRAGLEDSASFGMAGQASLGGVRVLGKTGTAEGAASSRTHGWFVALAPASAPTIVMVVYVPAGRGADAAHVAGEILLHAPIHAPGGASLER